ncbi:alcohol dehydrogenase GroES-like domain-containing protein [Aureobasidium pullulans]|nr:alcohol dehydrogenase GroES-like domain-containing protein [Aureobasidium pullulans]
MSSVPKTMRAARLVEYNKKYQIHEVDVPQYGENDLLVKIGAAGFCHTDHQVYEGFYQSQTPQVGSHEPAGTVLAVGSKAAKSFKEGQRVGVLLFRHACHECVGCKTTRDIRFCKKKEMAGVTSDGAFAEYMIADADNTVLLPETIPFEQAAPLMCAGATVWGGISKLGLPAGESVGILGIGGLGGLGVQFCKALGYSTVAIDNRPEGRDLATEFPLKADLVIDYNDEKAGEKIVEWSGKGGLAGIVVCTDNIQAIEWSLKTLRPHGICVPLGVPGEGFHFGSFDLIGKEIIVKGSGVANRSEVEEMMKVVASHGVKSYVRTVPFEKTPDLPEMYMDNHLKGRLVMKF